jgi:hypothetical protein
MASSGGRSSGQSSGGLRWWQRFRRARPEPDLDPSRADLVVVASSFDDAEAASATLERAGSTSPRWEPSAQAVLRHHLLLPETQVADAVAVAAQDGYRPATSGPPAEQTVTAPHPPDLRPLVLQRVQLLDALHCSQERSRMAGLAQRRDGVAVGWDALQPAPE